MITIFTDGSSRGNPGPGGWGAVIVHDMSNVPDADPKNLNIIELGGHEDNTTNNKMEITAAMCALEKVLAMWSMGSETLKNSDIIIYTDSSYLINGITKWVKGWQAKGWMTLQKKPVLNRVLWERLMFAVSAIGEKKISWERVGGHVGTAGNERCDEIATMFADANDLNKKIDSGIGSVQKLFAGLLRDYPIKNILKISVNQDAVLKKSESRTHSKAKAYSYVSFVDGVVQTHKTWQECESRVKGKKNAKYKKTISAADENTVKASFLG